MDFTIRAVRPEEYDTLGELTVRAYVDDGHLAADDGYLVHLRDVAARAEVAEVLVAVEEGAVSEEDENGAGAGTVLGGVTFVAAPGLLGERARAGEAEIRMLAVGHAARGRGAGEALVRACVERARAVPGCSAIVLSTQPGMRGAHRIYERLGFRRTPERDWSPVPERPSFVLMCYALEL
ncbi:GNAT family N-acetyltransferase [Streptomyces sp. NPDC090025]|uniref:GNAT family N-acetyltransferase n=1 Tax=Streptomyces sp. NPDC090025 TaxID=3365922 RepID=UPI003837FB44